MELRGKKALVTGASSGIGAATARALAAAGARVLLLARRQPELERVAATLGDRAAAVHAVDLTDADGVARVASRITTEFGTPDVVVNNAGAGQWKFVDETSPAEAVQMMAAPYFAAFFVTRAFLPGMLARGSGHIVNVSSTASRFVWPGATGYTAARWAVRGFTEALRADLDGTGVGVTLVEAGAVASSYWDHNPGSRERLPRIARLIPLLSPDDAARAIVGGIEGNRRLVVAPGLMRVVYLQHALFPRLVQWLMTRTGYQRLRP
jgi:NADP-dependent 3-hydroxy acid dehydrogenase YdfG